MRKQQWQLMAVALVLTALVAPATTVTRAESPSSVRENVALASSGATVFASSSNGSAFPPEGAINGDRAGNHWADGGGWNDGTAYTWPDWFEVDFAASHAIDEVDVFSVQDAYWAPVTPTPAQTFTTYGLTDFSLQYWDGTGWQDVPGTTVTGNDLVWRQLTFLPVTTTKIRLWITGGLGGASRIAEIEAWAPTAPPEPSTNRENLALATNGAVAFASSTMHPGHGVEGAINGDRNGLSWGTGGGWNDATINSWPDWFEVDFADLSTIDELDVFSVQDAYWEPVTPTETMTSQEWALIDFTLQYWDGAAWLDVPGGAVAGNNLIWRKLTFAPVTTTKIRLWITAAMREHSRIVELEAWGCVGVVSCTGSAPAPPTLTDLQPANGSTVSGTVTVSVTADGTGIVGVQFLIDGAALGAEDTSAPYNTSWNTTSALNGAHSVTATVRDGAGRQVTTSNTVTVVNVIDTEAPPIPEFDNWVANIRTYGAVHCDEAAIAAAIGSGGVVSENNVWYYDGAKVYHQGARYTGIEDGYRCADYSNNAYRDWVLTTTQGLTHTTALEGWRVFPEGLASDYLRTGNPSSKEAVRRLANFSAFAPTGGSPDCGLIRETAFILNAFLVNEELGEPRHPSFNLAVDNLMSHLNKMFVTRECVDYLPFMVGLGMESLIHYWENTGDARVPPLIETVADTLWTKDWQPETESFVYLTSEPGVGAVDLNLLIAPAYAWLWQLTGEERHRDHGDQVFAGGVRWSYLGAGKAYSQNYRSSYNYVKWRSQPPHTIQPLTRY